MSAALVLAGCASAAAATLDTVRARGHLMCGVADGPLGFSHIDERGAWTGLDVDFCAALAAAIFGRKDAVKYRPLTMAERFSALKAKEVDILARSATWTLSRDMDLGARFVGTLFHDGQGLLVRRTQGIASALELSGASVCALADGPAQQNLDEFFRQRGMRFTTVTFDKWDLAVQAYLNKRCTALSADVTTLALVRASIGGASEHLLLPEVLSKEPLGPVVRQGDEQWFGIVRWVLFALFTAEEYGVTSSNVDTARTSNLVEVRRLLGTDGDLGASLGLSREWAYHLIKQCGSYAELFERNVGMRSPLRLERLANNLWSKGGLMHAPPFR
ncbi:MAG: amino acid ABC transporter substrate-binding protein [Hyphomicrobiaceae bacterium]|nr:amino acid ABC transporter substrate-binding protein [Hyphomicrobiaceae bacterium]